MGSSYCLAYHVFCDALPIDRDIGSRIQYFLPLNGPMAVFVFFIASGFSLSIRYLQSGDIRFWVKTAAGRYFRLVIPIFASCLVVHIAMRLGDVSPSAERLQIFLLNAKL